MKQQSAQAIDRIVICQAFLDALDGGNYLEVGVFVGNSFIPIRATTKWGVDPNYRLTPQRRLKYRVFAALGLKEERLFRMTSDRFFQQERQMLTERGVDVAFLDGLHTYEQTLLDVQNTLKYLRPGGVIVLHDCNPDTELAATPLDRVKFIREGTPGWPGAWNGDVWKTIIHLRSLHPELETLVLDCDTGVGVVRRKPNSSLIGLSAGQIRDMNYTDFDANRAKFLGLKDPMHLWEIVESCRR